jgi:hypothetical protein
MAREKKFASPSGVKETPDGKLMETIVEDVIKAKTMRSLWRSGRRCNLSAA